MSTVNRSIVICILSVVGALLWFIADYTERGLTVGVFGGPVLVVGLVGVPSFLDYLKAKKLKAASTNK